MDLNMFYKIKTFKKSNNQTPFEFISKEAVFHRLQTVIINTL